MAAGATQPYLIEAADAGAQGSGLSGTATLLDTLSGTDWIESITVSGMTAGGLDGEDDETYLNNLSAELQLLSPRLILPGDFELFGRRRVRPAD